MRKNVVPANPANPKKTAKAPEAKNASRKAAKPQSFFERGGPQQKSSSSFAPCMFFPLSISNNPPPVSSENGSLNSSEEDTGGGLHFGFKGSKYTSDPGGSRGLQPREPRSRTDRFAPGAFEPVAKHWVAGSVSGFNLEPLIES